MKMMKINFLFLIFFTLILHSCTPSDHREEGGGYVIPEFYHLPDEINTFLDETAASHSDIVRVETIGQSVEGRDIKVIIISDNPETLEGEPAIRLTGAIHGSEIISSEILINFIEYLTDNYVPGNEVYDLLNSRYIAIIPVLNPDGFVDTDRHNANDVDLNRNFSTAWVHATDPLDPEYGDFPFSEPESQALRDFSLSRVFNISVTYHSGAVLVNMPFDYGKESEGIYPDENTLVKNFAKAYSKSGTFLTNPDLYNSVYMDEGTINGGDWYVIKGSLQDWSYAETGCLDLTIEVAKRSPSTEEGVLEVYNYNRDSLIAYINKAGYGVHGRVKDSGGDPVANVEIHLIGGDIVTKTDSQGYYHRILLPGNYDLQFSKTGFTTENLNITVPDSAAGTEQNITMN